MSSKSSPPHAPHQGGPPRQLAQRVSSARRYEWLGRGDAGEREPGQRLLAQEPEPGGVNRGAWHSVQNLAQKDELVDVVGNGRVPVPVTVVRGDEPDRLYAAPRLLPGRSNRGFGGRLADEASKGWRDRMLVDAFANVLQHAS